MNEHRKQREQLEPREEIEQNEQLAQRQLDEQRQAIATALARELDSSDTGRVDERLQSALAKETLPARIKACAEVFGQVRVIIPVYPHQQREESEGGCPPGALFTAPLPFTPWCEAAPVFSSLDALKQALPDARPVPVNGRSLALLALSQPGRILLDQQILLPRPALLAIGAGDTWLPAWENEPLERQIAQLVAQECDQADMDVKRLKILPQEAGPDRLILGIHASTMHILALQKLVGAIGDRLSENAGPEHQTDVLEIIPVAV